MDNGQAYELGRSFNFVGSKLEGLPRTVVRELLIPLIFILARPTVRDSFAVGFLTKYRSGNGEPSHHPPGPFSY